MNETLSALREQLLELRVRGASHWSGRLSASALSTATAVTAIASVLNRGTGVPPANDATQAASLCDIVQRGMAWLAEQQNEDGGFGDTTLSHSNIATSYLVLAAATTAAALDASLDLPTSQRNRLAAYLDTAGGLSALRLRYGTDKTFVVPILTTLAIAGLIPWREVPSLPFEMAALPQHWYRFVGLPVVSYALPALIAIGQVKFLCEGRRLSPRSWLRRACIPRTLDVLFKMQPDSGGYLEATPLTAFVVMSLSHSGRVDHPVVKSGLRFLCDSADASGSWPIDTNLATWVTSLATSALASCPGDDRSWSTRELIDWQLSCQHTVRHPFTGADPGGWGWTDLSGAVPDADDTPGAILSLLSQRSTAAADQQERIDRAVSAGVEWLLGLQNRDGGWPTFCRGWGKLPFDRSSTDLTAHAIRAFRRWQQEPVSQIHRDRMDRAASRGLAFLRKQQRGDGSWVPLWFGNQDRPDEDNPIYGTSRVLLDADENLGDAIRRGVQFLIGAQNPDGGWGGGPSVAAKLNLPPANDSTVEETALAVEALASLWERGDLGSDAVRETTRAATLAGTQWLIDAVQRRRHEVAWPIGFYFAKLWYYEQLYPILDAIAALSRVSRHDALRR